MRLDSVDGVLPKTILDELVKIEKVWLWGKGVFLSILSFFFMCGGDHVIMS